MLKNMVSKGLTIEELGSGTNIFAIGDIHGCLYAVEGLIERLPISWGNDFLIFLGDYIDRGPDSSRVIDFILDLRSQYPEKVIALKGNHEWMFERYLQGIDIAIFLYNGGGETLKSYRKEGKITIPQDHINFIREAPLYVEIGPYFFVHAGVNPRKSFQDQSEEDLLWIRQSFYLYEGKFSKIIVFGHTPFPEVLLLDDRIGLDTGCVYGGKLSAVRLPDREIFEYHCWR